MEAPIARGVLYVHSAPRAVCQHVEWGIQAVTGRQVSLPWIDQPLMPNWKRTEYAWEGRPGTGAAIASRLRGWEHLRFEILEHPRGDCDGSRWMYTPELGIFYAQTDVSGNTVVPEDRIRYAMEIAGGNASEVYRELRLALGQAWDDELEPFRLAGDDSPVIWMHQARNVV